MSNKYNNKVTTVLRNQKISVFLSRFIIIAASLVLVNTDRAGIQSNSYSKGKKPARELHNKNISSIDLGSRGAIQLSTNINPNQLLSTNGSVGKSPTTSQEKKSVTAPGISQSNFQVSSELLPDSSSLIKSSGIIQDDSSISKIKPENTSSHLPDLQGLYFWWKSEAVQEGDDFWIRVTVNNGGLSSSGPSHVRAYLSIDNDWEVSDDYYVGKKSVQALASGSYETVQWNFNFPDLESGSYPVWIVAVVDCDDEVTESNEINTWKCSTSFSAEDPLNLADIQAPYFSWESETVSEGDPFWVGATVYNGGSSPAGQSHVKAYLSTDGDWNVSDDYYLGKKSVCALPSDDSELIKWDFDFPDLGSGTYQVWILAFVDCDDEVTESDETNLWMCTESFTVEASTDLADLQGTYFWWKSETVSEGDPFWVEVTVNNAGSGSAGKSHVKAYLSTDNDWNVSDDYYLGKKSVSSLLSGNSETIKWNFDFPDIGSGSYSVWVLAKVDCDDEVTESDEINTWKCVSSFTVQDITDMADLKGSYFWWQSATANEGDPFWVKVNVSNDGSGSAGQSHVKAYLSTDNDWDISDDYLLGKKSVGTLSPGDSENIQWNFDFPDIGTGIYSVWIVAEVDCDNEVNESDENNIWKCVTSFTVEDGISGVPDISVDPSTLDIYNNEGNFSISDSLAKISKNQYISQINNDEHIRGLVIPEHVKDYWRSHIPKRSYDERKLKSSIDWSINDSPVKSQGSCGSCWAFSAVALIENLGGKTDLSEQVIVSCAQGDCNGGWYWDALEYINNYGIPPEACYPYTAQNGDCSDKCTDPAYIVKVQQYTPGWGLWGEPASVNDIKAAVQDGPICVGMKVPEDGTFDSYTGGIYDYNGGDFPWAGNGHAVLVVGYNDDQRYFKVKNSWGTWWGENGYFRISYDDVTDDVVFGCYGSAASGVYTEGMENTFSIQNLGTGELVINNIITDKNWLEYSPQTIPPIPPSGQKKITVTVTDWGSVTYPEETGIITITSNDPDEPEVQVTATAHHESTPIPSPVPDSELIINPDSLTFTNTQGEQNPSDQTFEITNGGEKITWTISDNADWLTVNPTSGTTTTETDVITISIDNSNLSPGNYTCKITITAPVAQDLTKTVNVSLKVLPSVNHFSHVDPTGDSRPVIIQSTEIEGNPIQSGDEIAVFDDSLCVGASTINKTFPVTITAWMEVSLPDGSVLPGAKVGNPMIFKIWENSTNKEMSARPHYITGSGNFGEPLTVIDSLRSFNFVTQTIQLKSNKLNLVSFNIMPEHLAVDTLFNDLENLSIVKDDDGKFYIPEYSVNTIEDVDLTNGYHVYIKGSEHDQITNDGTPLEPGDYTVELNNSKLFMIGYPYQNPYPVEQVFSSLGSSVLVVQDDEGQFWIPSYKVNTIGCMQPGKGYQIYVNDTVSFTYPNISPSLAVFSKPAEKAPEPDHFRFQKTGLPFAVIVIGSGGFLENGDELGIFADGLCVGSSVFIGEYPIVIAAWKEIEEYGLPGFKNSQTISLRIWRTSENREFNISEQFTSPDVSTFRNEPFLTISLKVMEPASNIPVKFALDQNWPNPFNPETKISYHVPEASEVTLMIYNLRGNLVKLLASGHHEAGNYYVTWDGLNEKGLTVNSGVYFYRLQAGKFSDTKKLILIK